MASEDTPSSTTPMDHKAGKQRGNMIKQKIGPPKNQAEFSANWKMLLASQPPKPQKRKSEDMRGPGKGKKRKLSEQSRERRDKKLAQHHKGKVVQDTSADSGKGTKIEEKKEIWFDDVDELLLDREPASDQNKTDKDPLVMSNAVTHATKMVAMDCEMVGVGDNGKESVLARVSIVNQHGHCLYDKFVMPREEVTDYRTEYSGIRASNLTNAKDFLVVQKQVSDLIKDRVLVGHAIHNDLKVLFLDHSKKMIRDTSRYKPFRLLFGNRTPSLKKLTAKVLGVDVQEGEHDSIQDAQAAMRLYMTVRQRWERELAAKHKKGKTKTKTKKKNGK